jgi:hypothetical protein
MYPQPELNRLAARKTTLRQRIALRRVQCAEVAARVTQPLEWLDRMLAFCRRLSPLVQFAAMPLGFTFMRAVFPRRKFLGSLARWSPLVFGAARAISSAVKSRPGSGKSSNARN